MPAAENDSDRNAQIQKIAEILSDIRICMLTTVDTDGKPWSRPMATQAADFDGDLWFFTRDDSEKVEHVQRNSRVGVAFAEPKSQAYVTMAGRALVVRDRKKMEALWAEPYKAWFPKGTDDPHLRLLKVEVERAEYWDSPASPIVYAFGYAKAVLTGKPADDLGEHGRVTL